VLQLDAVARQDAFFWKEHRLYEGSLPIAWQARSVLFFTVHTCASTFVSKALGYLNEAHALEVRGRGTSCVCDEGLHAEQGDFRRCTPPASSGPTACSTHPAPLRAVPD
jgi:hypothetical protein